MTNETFPQVPAKATPMTSAIWASGADAYAALIKAADAAKAVKGSAGEFRKRATEQVTADKANAKLLGDIAKLEEALEAKRAELAQKVDEAFAAMTGGLDSKKETAAAAFKSARADWDAFVTLASKDKAAAKVLATVNLPELPKGGSARTTSGEAKVTNASLVFFSKDNATGDEKPMSAQQNSLSSLAWYKAGELLGKKNGNAASLREFAKGKGVDTNADEWTVTLPSGRVLGCRKA